VFGVVPLRQRCPPYCPLTLPLMTTTQRQRSCRIFFKECTATGVYRTITLQLIITAVRGTGAGATHSITG